MSSCVDSAAVDLPMERRYRLVDLQKEELKVQTKIDDFLQWGAPALDQAGYHKKEATQRATAHSKRGSIFWALVERTPAHADGVFGHDDDVRDDEIVAGTTVILCHCESHAFDCTFRKFSGEIERGLSHNIGSVFTLPAHRGKGLARFFLTGVQNRMATLPNSIGSALYSDIGPTYYDSLGWRLYESTHAKLKLSAPRNASAVAADSSALAMLHLDTKLDGLLARDNARVENEMVSATYDGQEVFATRPSCDSVEWQFCIGVVYATIRGFPMPPTHTGVHLDDDAFAVWCHNVKESTLYIVHARFPPDRPAATVQLLRAAIVEARTFHLESVAIWDPSEALFHPAVVSELEIVKEQREDSLSSLLVFSKHRGDPLRCGVPVWLNNEKFAWV